MCINAKVVLMQSNRELLAVLFHMLQSKQALSVHRANPHYQDLRDRIDSIITQDFSGATEYAAVFEEHRKVYTYGQTWNFEAYSSKKKYAC